MEEEAEFKAFAAQPNLHERIFGKVAPNIFGHADIKRAVACLLFGGARKVCCATYCCTSKTAFAFSLQCSEYVIAHNGYRCVLQVQMQSLRHADHFVVARPAACLCTYLNCPVFIQQMLPLMRAVQMHLELQIVGCNHMSCP